MSSVFINIQSVGQPYNNRYHTSLCHNITVWGLLLYVLYDANICEKEYKSKSQCFQYLEQLKEN